MEKRTALKTGLDTKANRKKGVYVDGDKLLDGVIMIEEKINEEQKLNVADITEAMKKAQAAADSAFDAAADATRAQEAAANAIEALEVAQKSYLTDEIKEDGEFLTLHEKVDNLETSLDIFVKKEVREINAAISVNSSKLESIQKSVYFNKVLMYVAIAIAVIAIIISSTS